jgi:hypothetical protein
LKSLLIVRIPQKYGRVLIRRLRRRRITVSSPERVALLSESWFCQSMR